MLFQSGLTRTDRLDDQSLDFLPEQFGVVAILLQVLEDEFDVSLVALVHGLLIITCIELEIFRKFIDGVVGEMHGQVTLVALGDWFVLCCTESREAVVVEKNPQRIDASKQDIDPQIEFQILNEQWTAKIFLNDKVLHWWDLVVMFDDEDSTALARCFGFNNVDLLGIPFLLSW